VCRSVSWARSRSNATLLTDRYSETRWTPISEGPRGEPEGSRSAHPHMSVHRWWVLITLSLGIITIAGGRARAEEMISVLTPYK
jgi:hypothetical protein